MPRFNPYRSSFSRPNKQKMMQKMMQRMKRLPKKSQPSSSMRIMVSVTIRASTNATQSSPRHSLYAEQDWKQSRLNAGRSSSHRDSPRFQAATLYSFPCGNGQVTARDVNATGQLTKHSTPRHSLPTPSSARQAPPSNPCSLYMPSHPTLSPSPSSPPTALPLFVSISTSVPNNGTQKDTIP